MFGLRIKSKITIPSFEIRSIFDMIAFCPGCNAQNAKALSGNALRGSRPEASQTELSAVAGIPTRM